MSYSLGTDLHEYPNWVSINERVVLYKLLVRVYARLIAFNYAPMRIYVPFTGQ